VVEKEPPRMNEANRAASVLVIDDHRFQRSVLTRMLKAIGVANVVEAEDGAGALEIVRAHRDSLMLIVTDVDMPEMDGLELLRRLSEEAPQTAVAIHSALDRALLKSIEVMAAAYGVDLIGVLEKPVTEQGLSDVVARAAERTANPKGIVADANEAQVEAAVAQHEFEPWFQPKVHLRSGQVSGAEVLVRWCRLHADPLPPDRFLTMVRQSGMMRSLTLAVAARSAEYLAQVSPRGKDFTLSLNVCPTLLDDPEFAASLARALTTAGATPEEVVLEITESAASRNQGAALENLARLRMRGFELSIDDFGTGHSSLAKLVRTPFSELKIDREFVIKIATDPAARTLVESIVAIARRLGLRTVAEGIETEEQREILMSLNCDMGQGYLFAKPMAAADWLQWMHGKRGQQVAAK
jgi:EAL domain-containing protein (putative c-di-GMP-specific phosphodiesterase class I)/FixJ family two-component response regulator